MLTVKELRKFLDTVSDDAVVAVNGEIVTAPMLASGRMNTENTVGNPAFHRADKGRDQAVMFLHHRQLTTGEWVLDPI